MKFLAVIAPVLFSIVRHWIPAVAALEAPGGPLYPVDVVAQNYTDDEGVLLQGFLSLPSTATQVALPVVVVLHDSSGPDTYEQQRATMVARELGYIGFAADVYGLLTDIPEDTGGWAGPYAEFVAQLTSNATLFALRIRAAVDHVKSLPEVDAERVALIGYCLGGTGIVHYLNSGEKGASAGAVGFHPSIPMVRPRPGGGGAGAAGQVFGGARRRGGGRARHHRGGGRVGGGGGAVRVILSGSGVVLFLLLPRGHRAGGGAWWVRRPSAPPPTSPGPEEEGKKSRWSTLLPRGPISVWCFLAKRVSVWSVCVECSRRRSPASAAPRSVPACGRTAAGSVRCTARPREKRARPGQLSCTRCLSSVRPGHVGSRIPVVQWCRLSCTALPIK